MKANQKRAALPRSERLCRLFDIPVDSLPHGYSLELQGRSLLKLRGGGRILLYTPEEIKVSLPRAKGELLSIKGARLSCASYNKGTLGIEGVISSLCFERAGRS